MIKDPILVLNLPETHKIHRKAAMYAILGDLLFIVPPPGRDFNRIIVFAFFGVNGHALSLRYRGWQLDLHMDLTSST